MGATLAREPWLYDLNILPSAFSAARFWSPNGLTSVRYQASRLAGLAIVATCSRACVASFWLVSASVFRAPASRVGYGETGDGERLVSHRRRGGNTRQWRRF